MNVAYILIAFGAMLGMMLLGLPIAVAMAAIGIVGGVLAYGLPFFNSIAPVVWGVHNDNLLTAIPLFVLMGELLLRSGIADRMFGALAAWLIGLIVFAGVGLAVAGRATWLLLRGRITELNHEFGPRSTKEEVDEELEDLKARSSDTPPSVAAPAASGVHA